MAGQIDMAEQASLDPKQVYTEARITERLRSELPRWTLDRGALCRSFKTGGWKATLMATHAVGHLAEQAWHHPELELSFARLRVRLSSHDVQGVTERDFALALRIEELLTWQPGGALEGPPDDPQHRLVVDD